MDGRAAGMIVDRTIFIGNDELTERERNALIKKLTFTDNKTREVRAFRKERTGMRIHRGAWSLLPSHVSYVDDRVCPKGNKFTSTVVLDSGDFIGQKDVLAAMIEQEQGLIVAQPGFGKTQVALAFAAQCGTPTIVFVHTNDIFDQWVEYSKRAIPTAHIGTIQGSKWDIGDITIAMIQTVWDQLEKFESNYAERFGCVIVDEAHHTAATTWEVIMNKLPAKYRFGFTATETRSDALHPLTRCIIGPVIHKQKIEVQVETRAIPLYSKFNFDWHGAWDWQPLLRALIVDKDRNALIAETALRQVRKGQSTLILSRRIDHLTAMRDEMLAQGGNDEDIKILTGKMNNRHPLIKKFKLGEFKCLLSTQLMDESIDVPILSRVILTFPGKHDGKVIQQAGRAIRQHESKNNAIIFDVVDKKVGVLRRQWIQRRPAYKKMGIPIKRESEEVLYGTEEERKRAIQSNISKRIKRSRVTKRRLYRIDRGSRNR